MFRVNAQQEYSETRLAGDTLAPTQWQVERIAELPIDRYITIVEGTGKWK
jgi:hypothetical protein